MDLALGTTVAKGRALVRVIKDFRAFRETALAKLSNRSMRGVGTKVGTVDSLGSGDLG
jgi:hypothetical protein